MSASILAAFAAPILAAGCASSLLLHPSTGALPASGIEPDLVAWEQGRVEVWAARTPAATEPRATVLAFPGNAARAERLLRRLLRTLRDHPVEIRTVNYPGYGASDGPACLGSIPPAALAAFDAAAEAGRPVFVWAESIGTTAALHVASRRDVAGLVLRNPPPLKRLILVRHGWWNLWLAALPVALQIPSDLDALETAPRATTRAVFLMAQDDRVVPPSYQQLVFDAYGGPKVRILLAGGHNSRPSRAERAVVEDAFGTLLDGR